MTSSHMPDEFRRPPLIKFLITIGIVAITALVQWYTPYLQVTYMLFFPAIILSTLYGEGNFSILLGGVTAFYLFGEYEHTLTQESVNLIFFFISGFMLKRITKSLMEEKTRTRIALEELEREKEERDHFVACLTHDLQSPLTAAKLHSEILIRNTEDDQTINELASTVFRGLERMEVMIQDLLDVSQIQSGKMLQLDLDVVDLTALVEETVQEMVAVHGFRFVVQTEPQVKGLFCMKSIRRVLENLCSNAVKYGDDLTPVKITLQTKEDKVELSVNNKGDLLPSEEISQIFLPYNRRQGKNGQKGWGLGLALVKGLTEAQGGQVSVSSNLVEGTTFTVFLPLDAPGIV